MKDNYVAKNMGKFNKAAVYLDLNKLSKIKLYSLQLLLDFDYYLDIKNEFKYQELNPRHKHW